MNWWEAATGFIERLGIAGVALVAFVAMGVALFRRWLVLGFTHLEVVQENNRLKLENRDLRRALLVNSNLAKDLVNLLASDPGSKRPPELSEWQG